MTSDASTPNVPGFRDAFPGLGGPATVLDGLEDLRGAVGRHLGYGDWHDITQEQVDAFAAATWDHQWIHVDPEMAAGGPFGGTIAHGFLTLSLASFLGAEVVEVRGVKMGINYGSDRVRFPSPVKVGSRIRGGGEFVDVSDVAGGVQATFRLTVEIEGGSKPACVADLLTRYYF